MEELMIRFVIGGLFVTAFAMIGDVLRPKSFAGLFGAAPSVALATLSLTIIKQGSGYAATEARSMTLGAVAFFAYAFVSSWALRRFRKGTLATTICCMPIWFLVAFPLCLLLKRAS